MRYSPRQMKLYHGLRRDTFFYYYSDTAGSPFMLWILNARFGVRYMCLATANPGRLTRTSCLTESCRMYGPCHVAMSSIDARLYNR